jgi:hypothetical protein
MAIRLGTTAVTLKLGTQSITGRLGSQIVTASLPGAPTITSATTSTVNYSAPASNGGAAITAYRFYINGTLTTPTSGTLGVSATFSGSLASASVEVSAVNSVGEGGKSAPFTVATAPGIPTGLTVTTDEDNESSVDVSWTAPASNGGSAITGYRVYYSFNGTDYTQYANPPSTTETVAIAYNGGQTIYIRVSAVNAIGEGSQSDAATGTLSDSAPGTPGSVSLAVSGPLELSLSWSAPTSDGGEAITGYLITYTKPPSASEFTTTAEPWETSYTFTDPSGTQYSATVAATNSIGTGGASSPVTATVTDVPGSPSWMSSSASSGTQGAIDISFIAPGSDGGSAITQYEVEYDTSDSFYTAQSATFTDISGTLTLSDLAGGGAYYLRVRAVNVAGPSEWATFGSNPVTASATVPAVLTSFSVSPDYANNEWDATWTEESDGGSVITQYEIQESDADFVSTTTETKSGTGSSYSFGVDTPDSTRKFRIRATNAVGSSEWSDWVTAYYDTPTVPGAGTVTSAYYQSGQTVVNWSLPADDGNSGITTITVYIDGVAETPASIASGTHYFNADYTGQDATVSFTNAVGEGPQSAAVEVQPE